MKGDIPSFEELCKKKTSSVIYNAYSMLGNIHDAEDAAQETFMLMFKSIRKLKSPEAIDVWMLRICQNVCRRMLSKRGNRKDDIDIDDDEFDIVIEEDNREFLPEKYAEDMELSSKLYQVVMSLPEKRREVIFLYHYDDLSYSEISEIMGVSIKTVSTNLVRARKMIKDQLEKIEVGNTERSSVLGKVLKSQEALLVTDGSIKLVQGKLGLSLAGAAVVAKGAGVASVLSGKFLAVAAASVLALSGVAVTTVYYTGGFESVPATAPPVSEAPAVPVTQNPADELPVAEEVTPVDIAAEGEIEFISGLGEDGHVNPKAAKLVGANFEYEEAVWSVMDGGETTLYEGEGTDPSSAFQALLSDKRLGTYTLSYSFTDEAGNKIEKSREFEIE